MAAKKPKTVKDVATEVVNAYVQEIQDDLPLLHVVHSLSELVDAGENGAYVSDELKLKLITISRIPLIECSGNTVQFDDGSFCELVRATQAGFEYVMNERIQPESIPTPNASIAKMSKFEIEDIVLLPNRGRGRRAGSSVYPFDDLAVSKSFFVANTEEKPDMVKSLASTVSAAIRRYSVPVDGELALNRKGEQVQKMQKTRVFVICADIKNGVSGARISRIA